MRVSVAKSERITGVDIARGLAILGGIALWFLPQAAENDGVGLQHLLTGRVLVLFALLAGLSIGLLTGGTSPFVGLQAAQARVRIMVRAAAMYAIGHLLIIAGFPLENTLSTFAFLMVMLIPFIRIPARSLWITATLWIAALPVIGVLWDWFSGAIEFNGIGSLGMYLVHGDVPLLAMVPVGLIGLAISRTDLRKARVQQTIAAIGAGVLVVGFTISLVGGLGSDAVVSGVDNRPLAPYEAPEWETEIGEPGSIGEGKVEAVEMPAGEKNMDLSGQYCIQMMGSFYQCLPDKEQAQKMIVMLQQSMGASVSKEGSGEGMDRPEVPATPSLADAWNNVGGWSGYRDIVSQHLIAVGAAMLVLGASLILGRWLQPIAALGAMPLTAYVGLAVLAMIGTLPLSGWWVAIVALATIAIAFVWHRFVGRGPVEAVLHAIGVGAAHTGETVDGPAPDRDRVVGLDIARGLAVIGMIGAHMISMLPWMSWDPETWTGVMSGRPSILFALLAGISMAIMSGRNQPYTGVRLFQARSRILTRAFIIFGIGLVLTEFHHPIAIILDYYGVFFVLALPFLTWRPRNLFIGAAALAVATPFASYFLQEWDAINHADPLFSYLISGVYPAFAWLALMLFGLGLGRLRLGDLQVQQRLLAVGLALTVIAYGFGEWAEHATGNQETQDAMVTILQAAEDTRKSDFRLVPGDELDTANLFCMEFAPGVIGCNPVDMMGTLSTGRVDLWTTIGTWAPHSGSSFELFGSGGFAAMVVALCLLASRKLSWLLYPIAAVGTTALTVYVAHVFVFAYWSDHPTGKYDFFLIFLAIAIPAATLWKRFLGRGPLERALSWLAYRNSEVAG